MILYLAILITFAFVSPPNTDGPALPLNDGFDPGGCTTAVISGGATANGRPMLWKNRDVSYPDQEILYFDEEPYPFISITTAGDSTQAWGGVNSAGFAIEDANNWNTSDPLGPPDDDGMIMKLALRTCRTVSEFQLILDSTSIAGNRTPAMFGVIDTAGGGAIFETYTHNYIRYDANDPNDAPLGVLVRSNWSYGGNSQGRIGVFRHNHAMSLIEGAVNGDSLSPGFMFRQVMRDICNEAGLNPYPLPYEGTVGGLPQGWVSTYGAICRRLSVSACVIEGVLPGEDPLLSTMWAFPMSVQYGVPLPFWVASRATPPEVNGPLTGPLCDEGWRIRTMAQHYDGFKDTLDTYVLEDGMGGGVHAMTFPLEAQILSSTDSALTIWRAAGVPDSAGMTNVTQQLATHAYEVIAQWPQPGDLTLTPVPANDVTLRWVPGIGLRLRWSPVTENIWGWPQSPAGSYSVWHMSTSGGAPDSIGWTADTQFVVPAGIDADRAFFVVKARTQ